MESELTNNKQPIYNQQTQQHQITEINSQSLSSQKGDHNQQKQIPISQFNEQRQIQSSVQLQTSQFISKEQGLAQTTQVKSTEHEQILPIDNQDNILDRSTLPQQLIYSARTTNLNVSQTQILSPQFIRKQKQTITQINLVQSTPFNILQQSTSATDNRNQPSTTQGLFIQTHTQEINLEQSITKRQEEVSQQIVCQQQSNNNQSINRQVRSEEETKNKFNIFRTVQINFSPEKQKPKEEAPKPEPLKIQNLFISSLRSKSQIKPPQSTTEKKPKPWQKFKNKKSINQNISQPVAKKQSVNLNELLSEEKLQENQSTLPVKENIKKQEQEVKFQIKTQAILTNIVESKIQQKPPLFEAFKPQQKQNQSQPAEQKKDQLVFHPAIHHPLQYSPLLKIPKQPLQQINDKKQQIIQQKREPVQQIQISQPKTNLNPLYQVGKNIEEERQQSVSSSQKQQIEINYNLKKKSQQEEQRIKRQKILQLQENIRKLTEINKQLQKSVSLPLRLLVSAAIGLGSGGITWALKKDKLGSIIVGIASTMAILVLSS